MNQARIEKIDAIFGSEGPVLRTTELRLNGFCSKDIMELLSLGYLSKLKTGYYIKTTTLSELSEIELVSLLMPQGVLCLFSAAHYHNMITKAPENIYITLPKGTRTPVLPENPQIDIYKALQKFYELGIEEITMPHCAIKVYNRERTVCGFFRVRKQIGEDVTLKMLKKYMSGERNLQLLYEYAEILQIKSVLHPYVQALL